jgi:hypothetical protein
MPFVEGKKLYSPLAKLVLTSIIGASCPYDKLKIAHFVLSGGAY